MKIKRIHAAVVQTPFTIKPETGNALLYCKDRSGYSRILSLALIACIEKDDALMLGWALATLAGMYLFSTAVFFTTRCIVRLS